MRRQLHRTVEQARVVAAAAESLPLRSRSLDAVTVAQAFHWFRHDDALAEFARVVRPGGAVALVWNVDDPVLDAGPVAPASGPAPAGARGTDRPDAGSRGTAPPADGSRGTGPVGAGLSAEIRRVCDRYEQLRPRPPMRWRAALDRAPGWGTVGEVRLDGSERLDVDKLVDRVASRSFALLLDPADRAELLGEVRALADAEADSGGAVTLPTVTVMFWRRRT
jgi:SAM-dependent methyltransferase